MKSLACEITTLRARAPYPYGARAWNNGTISIQLYVYSLPSFFMLSNQCKYTCCTSRWEGLAKSLLVSVPGYLPLASFPGLHAQFLPLAVDLPGLPSTFRTASDKSWEWRSGNKANQPPYSKGRQSNSFLACPLYR